MDNYDSEFLRQTETIGKIGSWKIDIADDKLTWTQGIFDILEMGKYDTISVAQNINDYLPEYREQVMAAIRNCIDYDIPIKLEAEVYTSSKKRKWVELVGKKCHTALVGTLQDITERKVAEETIKQSSEVFKATFFQSPMPSALISMDLRFIQVNQAMLDLSGYTEEEFMLLTPSDLTHPDEIEMAKEIYTKLQTGEIDRYTMRRRFIAKGGKILHVRLHNRIIKDAYNKPKYFLPILEDISAELEFKRVSERFRIIFDNAPIGMTLTDKDGNIVEINQEQLRILGTPNADFTKTVNMATFPPLRKAGIGQAYEKCLKEGIPVIIELPYTNKWGKETYFRSKINPLFDKHGKVSGCISVVEDILDRVRAQNDLTKSEERFLRLFSTIKEAVDILDRELKHSNRPALTHKRALPEATQDTKLAQINDALLHTQGNIKKAAIYLGISRSALHRLISKYNIDKIKFK